MKRRPNHPQRPAKPSNPPTPAVLDAELQRGLAHHRAGQAPQAEAIYRQILEAAPNHPEALHLLAVLAYQRGQFTRAVELADKALRQQPDHVEAHGTRGSALVALERYQAAVESFDHALRLRPDWPDAWNNRGGALHALNRYQGALHSFDQALRLRPDYAEAHANRATVQLEFNSYQAAVASFQGGTPDTQEHGSEPAADVEASAAEAVARIATLSNKARVAAELDALPLAVRLHPAVCRFRAVTFQKKRSCGRDLVFYCHPTNELWNPQTAATRGIGGSEEAVLWLSRLLHARGWNVTVYAGCGLQPVDDDGVAWRPHWMWNRRDRQDVTVIWRHPQLLSSEIHSAKVFLDLHDAVPEDEFTPERLERVHAIFVKSRFHRSLLPRVPDDKFVVVPNGIDGALFEGAAERDPLLLINTSAAERSLEAFLDCFAEIRKQVPGARAHWAYGWSVFDFASGSDPRRAEWKAAMQARMAELGVQELGRIGHAEVAALYRRANVFAYPSEYAEIDCISLSKAMAAGAIPITTDFAAMGEKSGHGGIFLHSARTRADWVQPHQFCFALTDPEQKAQFVQAAVQLLTHPPGEDDREPMRHWARTAFDWNRIADAWHQALTAPRIASSPASADPALLAQAITCHREGRLADAEALYRQILALDPAHLDALYLLAVMANQLGRSAEALDLADRAIRSRPEVAEPYAARGNALTGLGRHAEAIASFDRALQLRPDFAEAHNDRANPLHELRRYAEAVASCDAALRLRPDFAEAHANRGNALNQLGRHQEALASLDTALRLRPDLAQAHSNRGNALIGLWRNQDAIASFDTALRLQPELAEAYANRGTAQLNLHQAEAALASFDEALRLKPDFVEAHVHRGNALFELRRFQDALDAFDTAIRRKPDGPEPHANRGNTLNLLQQFPEALASLDRAIALKPDFAEAHNNRGNTLYGLRRFAESVASFDRAIALKPDLPEAHNNRGSALHMLQQFAEALASFDRAIALRPDYAEAYTNRGAVLHELGNYPDTLEAMHQALRLNPAAEYLHGTRLHMRGYLCDWDGLDAELREVEQRIQAGERVAYPFALLSLSDSPALQAQASAIYARDKFPPQPAPAFVHRARRDKIRIGYFSADFRNHATTYLMAELLERHDRSRFQIFGFSFGVDVQDAMRSRVSAAVDEFFDVRNQSDAEIAQLSRDLEIDIAVDLKGFTKEGRPGIFACRAAPIQASYLGYPGTMAMQSIDYLIADATVVPESARGHYTEKIVTLPHSYQVNDAQRIISAAPCSRSAEGLPEQGFVFCCFNTSWKILPETFAAWMRLLAELPGSVLWLLEDNPWVAANLRAQAVRHGIAAERLVFAPRRPQAEHLARHRLADLVLDTLPYNAHTTASDALWAGLPVLTCMGQSFAGRVSTSLLRAIHLPELITTTPEEYWALALALARDPARLGAIRDKLARNRLTTPLFDTAGFTRDLEAAYTAMVARYDANLPPDPIHIAPRQSPELK